MARSHLEQQEVGLDILEWSCLGIEYPLQHQERILPRRDPKTSSAQLGANTFHRLKIRGLGKGRKVCIVVLSNRTCPTHLDPPHTSVSLVDCNLAKALVSVSSTDSLDIFNLSRDQLGHSIFEGLDVSRWGRGKSPRKGWTELERKSQ